MIRVNPHRADRTYISIEQLSCDHAAIDGSNVSINAEMLREKGGEGASILRNERCYGRWSRSFTLGLAVNETKAGAKYSDDILMLTLPKKAA